MTEFPKEEECEVTLIGESIAGEARVWLEKVDEFNPFETMWNDEPTEAAKMDSMADAGAIMPLNYEAYFWYNKQKELGGLESEFSKQMDEIKAKLEKEWSEEDNG